MTAVLFVLLGIPALVLLAPPACLGVAVARTAWARRPPRLPVTFTDATLDRFRMAVLLHVLRSRRPWSPEALRQATTRQALFDRLGVVGYIDPDELKTQYYQAGIVTLVKDLFTAITSRGRELARSIRTLLSAPLAPTNLVETATPQAPAQGGAPPGGARTSHRRVTASRASASSKEGVHHVPLLPLNRALLVPFAA